MDKIGNIDMIKEKHLMNCTMHVLILNCLLLFLNISNGWCGSRVHLLQGRVTDSEGKPVPFAMVTLLTGGDSLTRYTTYSDREEDSGQYDFYLPQDIVTSIKESYKTEPESFVLGQNSPNPFNPMTTIPYELSEPGYASLEVYNTTGQRVKVLISDYKDAGRHTVVWNGRDEDGRFAGAGVYLYRLRHKGRSHTRKMVLIDGGGTENQARFTGNSSVNKAAIQFSAFSIVVEKKGYEKYRIDNLRFPADGEILELNIELESLSSPEDYFHLNIGNTWTFISFDKIILRNRLRMKPENLYEEWSMSIVDTVTIDSNMYYVFDRFSPFFPKPGNSDIEKPVVRITEDGNLVMRDRNVDFLIYYFSQPELYNPHSEYRDVLSTYVVEHECAVKTPSGTYTDCRRVSIDNGDYYYDVWFSRSAGPVYCSYDSPDSEPDIFLEKADVDSVRFGVTEGVLSGNGISDNDMKEIYRLLMDPWWFEFTTTLSDNFFYSGNPSGDFVFSSENIDLSHIPERLPISFEILSPEVIQQRANIFWEYWYYKIKNLIVEDNSITVEIEFLFKLAEDNHGSILAGGGFIAEFIPKFGMWISYTDMTWISKTAGFR